MQQGPHLTKKRKSYRIYSDILLLKHEPDAKLTFTKRLDLLIKDKWLLGCDGLVGGGSLRLPETESGIIESACTKKNKVTAEESNPLCGYLMSLTIWNRLFQLNNQVSSQT